jgi:O-antigen/teichoic acid export membrane protein
VNDIGDIEGIGDRSGTGAEPTATRDSSLKGMARGGSLNLVGAVCNQLSLFAITAIIAVALGTRAVGRYGECFALLSLLGLLSLCGFRSALTRFVAMHLADDDNNKLRGTVRLGMGLSIVSAVVFGLVLVAAARPIADVFHDPSLVTGIRLTGLTLPAATVSDAALAATQGWRTQRPYTFIGLIFEPVLRLALTALALAFGFGLTGAFWALTIAAWAAALLALRALQVRMRRAHGARPTYGLRDIFSFSMISWVSALASTGLIWASTLILGAMTDASKVGVYNVATRLVTLAVFVMLPINASFTPHIAHLHHTGQKQELARMYAAATSWIVRLSLPAFVALIVFPGDLLRVFGDGFAAGASVTVILAVGQLVRAGTGPCGTLLNMSGRVAVNMADNVGVLILNIALNLILIPPYGIEGSAVAWSVSLALVNILRVWQVHQIVGISPLSPESFKGLVAAIAAAAAGVTVRALPWSWGVELVVGLLAICVVYVGVSVALGFSASDRLVLRTVTGRGGRKGRDANGQTSGNPPPGARIA